MSFAARELSVLAYANGFTLWHYRTAEDDLLNPGYFDSAQELLREGDQIIANTGAPSLPGIVNLVVRRVDDGGVAVAHTAPSTPKGIWHPATAVPQLAKVRQAYSGIQVPLQRIS